MKIYFKIDNQSYAGEPCYKQWRIFTLKLLWIILKKVLAI